MGTIHSNEVSVAIENLTEQESLGYLGDSAPIGLVVSIFIESEQQEEWRVRKGELAWAICNRVKKASRSASERLEKWMDHLGTKKPGDVVGFNLGLAGSDRAKFPIDRVIVVTFEKGHSSQAVFTGFLDRSVAAVVEDARREGLAGLVVPCIGYRWDEKHSLAFGDVFKPLFNALDGSGRPMKVFVSLYDIWPSMVIENAVRALNQAGGTTALTTARHHE